MAKRCDNCKLSMPLLMKGDAPVAKALKMLDEALGKQDESKT